MQVHIAAGKADGIFTDKPHQQRVVVPRVEIVETRLIVFLADVLELVTADRTRSDGGAERFVRILRLQGPGGVRQSHYAAQGIHQRNHAAVRVRTLEVAGAAVPDVGCHLAAAEFLRRSEEHTSELQSRENLVCRLLLEKKKKQ